MTLRLGVNIDHIATLRNARGEKHPDVVRAALAVKKAGADGITLHLREDRRHIRDGDIPAIMKACDLPLNLEMAATQEMIAIALKHRPNACCLVPEKREELTTEGGLNVAANRAMLKHAIAPLKEAGIRVSLFIDPNPQQVQAAADCGADIVELHTGTYAQASPGARSKLAANIADMARMAAGHGLECHAGHGLTFENVSAIARIPQIVELNIGHFLIGEAVFAGLDAAILQMREHMQAARL